MNKTKWQKEIKGNLILSTVQNPLRHYIQKTLPSINLQNYPQRSQLVSNLSVGDPTVSLGFRTNKGNLEVISKNVGKIDGYSNTQGLQQCRSAISKKYQVESFQITKDDVYMSSGGSQAILVTMLLLANQGDNFLFPSPGFPLSLTIAKSMKIQPRYYHLDQNNKWNANIQEMESLIDEKTKFILVNDPSNPLGACWDVTQKRKIIQLCKKKKIPLLADEIYQGMIDNNHVPTFSQLITPEEVDEITIFKCSGLTKRYLGPGWRLGWIIVYASEQNRRYYRKYLRGIFNVFLMPNTIMQCSVKQILESQENNRRMKQCMDSMKQNKIYIESELKNLSYCKFGDSSGALYATILIDIQKFKSTSINNAIDFSKEIFAEQNVKVFPGDFFVSKVPFIRLVVTRSRAQITQFLIRFKRFCQNRILNGLNGTASSQ